MVSVHTRHRRPVLSLAAACLAVTTLAGCGQRDRVPTPPDVDFVVDTNLIGPIYENRAAGVTLQPPLNWQILDQDQRRAVLDALAAADEGGDYSLDVQDVFFDTDSMSFLSVSKVTRSTRSESPGTTPLADEYSAAFAETIGLTDRPDSGVDTVVVARASFSVNNVGVTQFRHLKENRVTFTLMFANGAGELVQLDYSIPTETYQREAVKLESSIGTLNLLKGDQS